MVRKEQGINQLAKGRCMIAELRQEVKTRGMGRKVGGDSAWKSNRGNGRIMSH